MTVAGCAAHRRPAIAAFGFGDSSSSADWRPRRRPGMALSPVVPVEAEMDPRPSA